MKRLVCVLLCACLLAGALRCPVSASKEPLSVREQVIADAKMSYQKSLQTAGQESFRGLCGLMTSHQLYNLKINTTCVVNDGNKQFDYYLGVPVTTGGYYTTPYFVDEYDLRSALGAVCQNGTKDVFNVLVCFQWTSTESGSLFGHSFLINAILDGVCYFVESFDFSTTTLHTEGSVVIAPIDEVADYFQKWTTFEGLIHFGTYADSCDSQNTDATVMARFASCLRTQPAQLGQHGCTQVRAVDAGERLRVTGILTDKLGQRFYRVPEGGQDLYIAADAVSALRVNPESLTLEAVDIPQKVRALEDGDIGGTVIAQNGNLSAVEVMISNQQGVPVLRERMEVSGRQWELSGLNEELQLDLLEPGRYTLEIYADCRNPVVVGGDLQARYERTRLWQNTLLAGGSFDRPAKEQVTVEPEKIGWVLEQGCWRYYYQGEAVTGWVELCGVRYYLDAEGKAVTGWQEIGGARRYFSHTGAMVTGSLVLDGEEYFLAPDGSVME